MDQKSPVRCEELWDVDKIPYKSDIWNNIETPWQLLEKRVFTEILSSEIEQKKSNIFLYQGVTDKEYLFHESIMHSGKIEITGLNKVNKGELRCYLNGKLLPGASYIQAGVAIYSSPSRPLVLGDSSYLQSGSYLEGASVLGERCEVRHGAYLRGDLLIGSSCLLGHASEFKRVIMHEGAKAPHFAYVGDSILGAQVNLGAGTKVSNLKLDGTDIVIRYESIEYPTQMRKLGGILGDCVETGCNAVLHPGALLGKSCAVYPNVSLRSGYYPAQSWIKS